MSLLSNIGDWFTLGQGNTYRKIELYSMEWPDNTDLDKMFVAAAPFGGPIALSKDWRQFQKLTGTSTKPKIHIFTAAGHLISTIDWNSGTLLTMFWSDSDELLCVQNDGVVLIYDMFGKYQHKFSMGQEAKDTKVIDAKVYPSSQGNGIAVMTTHFRIFIVNNIKEPKTRLLPEMPKSVLDPSSWDIVVEDRKTCCIIVREKEIFKLKQDENICMLLNIAMHSDYKSIKSISVSFNHKHIAFYMNNGYLWMGSADLKTKYCEFFTGRLEIPKQIAWCIDPENSLKAEALIVTYPSMLLTIGVNGDSNVEPYDLAIHLVPEMDGVRVLTNGSHELIQKVPKCVASIFGINISEPSSFLFEAHRKFREKSHQSDEYLCLIMDRIETAVDECIEAAGYEFDTETQKNLIRAAHFGKGFIKGHDPDEYIQKTRVLRVLNAIRQSDIGMPLTIDQFYHLKPNVVLDRLVFRKHYGLAIQIAKHLTLSETRILEHWAYHKIINEPNEREVVRKISEKFKNPSNQGVSFCTIAKKAEELGKTQLAIMLLELELNQSLQVPLLLKLNENKKALLAATQSGDTDLVYMVLMQLKETTPLAKFQMTIRDYPLAHNLYKKYCQLVNVTALKDIYLQEDDFVAQAETALEEGLETPLTLDSTMMGVSNSYKKAHKDIESELCDDDRKLMRQQKALEEKYTRSMLGLSLHDTIKELLLLGDIKQAERMKNDHKMSDRHFYSLRIDQLSQNFQWDELEKLSKNKKIGMETFVEVCIKQHNMIEAKKYILKCRDDKKIKYFTRAELYEDAAKLAFDMRDLQSLLNIQLSVFNKNDRVLSEKINNYITQLSSKK